jgi:hypothetical protein
MVVLVLLKQVAPNPPTKPAFMLEFDWLAGCKPAELPEFCCPPSAPRGAYVTFGFIPLTFPPMAAMGILLGEVAIALDGGVSSGIDVWVRGGRSLQHHSVAQRELGLINCANTQVSLV